MFIEITAHDHLLNVSHRSAAVTDNLVIALVNQDEFLIISSHMFGCLVVVVCLFDRINDHLLGELSDSDRHHLVDEDLTLTRFEILFEVLEQTLLGGINSLHEETVMVTLVHTDVMFLWLSCHIVPFG